MTIQGLCVAAIVAAAVAAVFGVPFLAFRFAGNMWGWVAVATDIGLFCIMHMKYPPAAHTRSNWQHHQPPEMQLSHPNLEHDWTRAKHWTDTNETPFPDYWQATHEAGHSINPASGLPMMDNAFDIGGNMYWGDTGDIGSSSGCFDSSCGCDIAIDSFGVDMNDNW
jgi:hypothetical protein